MHIDDGRVFISQYLTHKDLTIFGDGSQTRSYCYVVCLIDGIYKILSADIFAQVNIGNPSDNTIK